MKCPRIRNLSADAAHPQMCPIQINSRPSNSSKESLNLNKIRLVGGF